MSKEQKKKLGLGIYYTVLIIAIVVMLASLVIIKSDDSEYVTRMRYIIAFYCFASLISAGVICREFLVEEYILKKMIIKIVVTVLVSLIGTVVFILVKNAQITLLLIFVSMGTLLFNTVPTIPQDKKIK